MTTEQKLSAVIEAQVRGGSKRFMGLLNDFTLGGRSGLSNGVAYGSATHQDRHILEILLDPEGLKGAYGDSFPSTYAEIGFEGQCECKCHTLEEYWKHASIVILRAWLSSGAEAAISTAFDLLPKEG